MSGVNKVILVGNVGKDPEIRTMQNGNKIANLTVATSETWKDKATGQRKEKTEWHKVVVFNDGLVGVIDSFVRKGSKVYIEGSLQTRKWTDNAGLEKYSTEVVLQGFGGSLVLLDSRNAQSEEKPQASSYQSNPSYHAQTPDLDDEIPF